MLWNKRLSERSPGISRSVTDPVAVPTGAAPIALKRAARPRVAVFITHGMGQQVPFETLDAAAEGLAQAAARQGQPVSAIRAATVEIAGLKTQRAEFEMKNRHGQDVEVHVYEGYWAPFTEGQVTLRDVMSFLLRAGLNGLRNCYQPFERWIFGSIVDFGRRLQATIPLLAALGVVTSLIVLNLLIAVNSGDRLFNKIRASGSPTFTDDTFYAFTTVAGIFVIACLVVGGLLAILSVAKPPRRQRRRGLWKLVTFVTQLLVYGWVALTIACAAVLLCIVAGWVAPQPFVHGTFRHYWALIWSGLLLASWVVRGLIIQYAGDVAAYVCSHTLDRFNDIRARIKSTVFQFAKAVYMTPDYEHVALLGHSLGSVVMYDTLNALINDDRLNGTPLKVVERTTLLLTFGSPLDKTAFIFASQWANTTSTREALAASLQPLIVKYVPYRDIKWINVYAPRDIVSGRLEFYDDVRSPDSRGRTVRNVPDPDATIPLVAHVEYWRNATLFDELYANL